MKPKVLLCPVDFSEHSELALRHAGAWAERVGAKVVALTVERFDVPPYLTPELLGDIRARVAVERKAALGYLREFSSKFLPRKVRVGWLIRQGDPVEEILRAVRGEKAGAVVMGTHGRSGMKALMMGSVTEAVALKSRVPLLVVRAAEHGELSPDFRRVVVPDDGTAETRRLTAAARSLGPGAAAELARVPVPGWRTPGASEPVLRRAEEGRADLIAVHLASRKLYGGSFPDPNTTQVLRFAPCPVLVLPR